MIQHQEITERVKSLILKNHVSDYYVWKNAEIPNASFSMMINNKAKWKLEFLVDIAELFNESFVWLVFGDDDHIEKKILYEIQNLKEENTLLKEELKNYRAVKDFIVKSSIAKESSKKEK